MKNFLLLILLVSLNISCGVTNEKIQVYMTPSCGCCKKWVSYLKENGFEVESIMLDDMGPIKTKYGVPEGDRSCHTGIVNSYFVEGHVPVNDIRELLSKKPDIAGITVPGMPAGQNVPGMETVDTNAEYDVLYVRNDGSTDVWNSYN